MSAEAAAPRPASTVLLLRERAGIEVFMMVRHYQIEFASGALVFPGGSVDKGDREIAATPELYSLQDPADAEDLTFRIAAIRETFEESGILLARQRGGEAMIAADHAVEIADRHRVGLCEGKIAFASIIADNDLVLAPDQLEYYARWITPTALPKRFDTRFFLAKAPPDQLGRHDGRESTDSIWISPREAVEGGASGRFKLPFPTTRNLIKLDKSRTVDAALAETRGTPVVTVEPVMSMDGDTRILTIPAEAGYDGSRFEITGNI